MRGRAGSVCKEINLTKRSGILEAPSHSTQSIYSAPSHPGARVSGVRGVIWPPPMLDRCLLLLRNNVRCHDACCAHAHAIQSRSSGSSLLLLTVLKLAGQEEEEEEELKRVSKSMTRIELRSSQFHSTSCVCCSFAIWRWEQGTLQEADIGVGARQKLIRMVY